MSILVASETHEPPDWIVKELTRMAGYGAPGKPRYRVIWGANRIIPDAQGVLYRPYQQDRWHLEKWDKDDYHHCYKFGTCTHMKPGETLWCKPCFISGGEFVDIATHMQIVRRAVYMLIKTEEFQSSTLQKAALMEREQKKDDKASEHRKEFFKEAFPTRVSSSPVTFKEPKLTKGVSKKKSKDKLFVVN